MNEHLDRFLFGFRVGVRGFVRLLTEAASCQNTNERLQVVVRVTADVMQELGGSG